MTYQLTPGSPAALAYANLRANGQQQVRAGNPLDLQVRYDNAYEAWLLEHPEYAGGPSAWVPINPAAPASLPPQDLTGAKYAGARRPRKIIRKGD